jgi:hypothetical protein
MLKKTIAPLLIGTVLLFAVVPAKAIAQTLAQAKAAESGHTLSDAQVRPKPDLKAVFAREMANVKARSLTASVYKQAQQDQQDQTTQQTPKKEVWSKREKVGLIVFIGIMLVVTTALVIHGISTEPSCFDQPGNPNCVP